MDLSQLNQEQLSHLLSLVNLVQPPVAGHGQPTSVSPLATVTGDVNNRLTSEQLGRLQAFVNNVQPPLNHTQVQAGSQTQPNPSGQSSWVQSPRSGQNLASQQPTSVQPSSLSASNSRIGPYQSLRTIQNLPLAPQGYPSTSMPSSAAGPSSQPFPGFGSLSLSMRGTLNQRRLASSARNPAAPAVRRRMTRRASIAPPALPLNVSPNITDCLEDTMDSNGVLSRLLRIKVKVYPPLV